MNKDSVIHVSVPIDSEWLHEYIRDNHYHVGFLDFKDSLDVRFLVKYYDGYLKVEPIMIDDKLLVSNTGVTVVDGIISTK